MKVPIKFHRHPSSGSFADTCEFSEGRTDMAKLIEAVCDYANP
jgi:hypothetical protein